MKRRFNKVRIIAGRMRGRLIEFDNHDGLRPTGDRLRETLFSWLHTQLPGSGCLDMFAGSGVLGFEALSRGAASVDFFEVSSVIADRIQDSADSLDVEGARIITADVLDIETLCSHCKPGSIDIAFIDPPFAGRLQQQAVQVLHDSDVLAVDASVVIESDRRDYHLTTPTHWDQLREKVAGEVRLQLFRVTD